MSAIIQKTKRGLKEYGVKDKKFKNKKATDPSMEEAIEKELRELREKDSEPVAE